jgi:hypothetical protein
VEQNLPSLSVRTAASSPSSSSSLRSIPVLAIAAPQLSQNVVGRHVQFTRPIGEVDVQVHALPLDRFVHLGGVSDGSRKGFLLQYRSGACFDSG